MSQICISNLTFRYDGSSENIFENISLNLDSEWKLGLIGRNGRGKTTLLKLLAGEYEYSGKISSNVTFEYYPYKIKNETDIVYDIIYGICGAQQWEAVRELTVLEMRDDILWRQFCTLSNGERTKIMLASLFLRQNAFLLIDEPTNHLDAKTRLAVANYLRQKSGFILVSHDRKLLDLCTDHILSINKKNIDIVQGNFSSWELSRAAAEAFEKAQNNKLENEIKRLKESAKHSAAISAGIEKTKKGQKNSGLRPDRGFVGHRSAKMMKRAKTIEKRRENAIEEKSKLLLNVENDEDLKLTPLINAGKTVLSANNVSVIYNGTAINKPLSFNIEPGTQTALCGINGCGKSSILKLISGEDINHTGEIYKNNRIIISYIPQDTSFLKGSLSDLAADKNIDESKFKAILRKLDFERSQFEKDMSKFSDGQKKKALIAASLCQSAHLYIWDEPLNFIDVISRIQIEKLLLKYRPTLIFVEHDSAFCEKIASDTIEMQ